MHKALKTLIPTVTNMIRADHTHVLATFHQYEVDTAPGTKRALVNTICFALEIHAQLEEEIFYPAMRSIAGDAGVVGKSVAEHDEMRRLIARLREMGPGDAGYDATVMSSCAACSTTSPTRRRSSCPMPSVPWPAASRSLAAR